jgi:hypothetical protein
MKKLMFAAALGAGLTALAANVDTTISTATTLTEKQTDQSATLWSPLHVNADLTVDGGKLYLPYGAKLYLPDAADATATLLVTNSGQIEFYWPVAQHASAIYVGRNGGHGRLVCSGNGSVRLNHVQVEANATADESGYVDFLEVGPTGNTVYLTDIVVNGTTPARVVFKGAGRIGPVQNMTASDAQQLFKPSASSRLVLWADEGSSVWAYLDNGQSNGQSALYMNSGDGVVETAGPGSFVASSSGAITEGCALYLNGGPDKVAWNHAGDTVISNGVTAVLTVDDALPCGPQTGGVVLTDDPWQRSGRLDLAGHVAGVNSLRGQGDLTKYGGGVTNSSETAAVLEFGRGGLDGTCAISNVSANVTFRKVGTGTLVVRDTRVDVLEVTDGICRIGENVKVGRVRVTGGYLEVEEGVTLDCDDVSYSGSGAARRATAGDAAISGAANVAEPLHVAAGTLKIYDSDRDSKFWRLVIRGVHTGTYAHDVYETGTSTKSGETQNIYAALQRIHLFGYENAAPDDGKRLNANLAEAAVGTAALEPGQIASAKPYLTGKYDYGNVAMTSVGAAQATAGNGYWEKNVAWNNALPQTGDPSTWETLTMRLADGTAPVASFAYVTSCYNPPAGNPKAINVECSADGIEWVVKYANDSLHNRHYAHPAFYRDNENVTSLTNNPHGAFNACPSVEVSAGATLDVSGLPRENVSFKGLSIDLDRGAGTITYFAPAADGGAHLRTTNAVAAGVFAKGPSFTEVGGNAKNLKNWKVYVNGVHDSRWVLSLTDDGQLSLAERQGLILVIR